MFRSWKAEAIRKSPLDNEWQTRRIIKPQPERGVICKCPGDSISFANFEMYHDMRTKTGWIPIGEIIRPRYHVGEVVYIKEAWVDMVCVASTEKGKGKGESRPIYKLSADSTELKLLEGHWKSPLFMPAWAARTFIQITDVRAERLQEITREDVEAEGTRTWFDNQLDVQDDCPLSAQQVYSRLWNSINPKYPWSSNPWVFVYCFKKSDKEVGK